MSKLQQEIDQIVKEADAKYTAVQKVRSQKRHHLLREINLLLFPLSYVVMLSWYMTEVGPYHTLLPQWMQLDPALLHLLVNGFALLVALDMLKIMREVYGVERQTKLAELPYGYLKTLCLASLGVIFAWVLPFSFSVYAHGIVCLLSLHVAWTKIRIERINRQYAQEKKDVEARIQALINNATPEELAEARRRCEICEQESKYDICLDCENKYRDERHRVKAQNARAKQQGLDADLTLRQWLDILKAFDFKCAYCQVAPVKALDHYIPIALGGGTTASNVLPACTPCNSKKAGKHPEE